MCVCVCFELEDRCGSIKAVVRHQIPAGEIALNELRTESIRAGVCVCMSVTMYLIPQKPNTHILGAVQRVSVLSGELQLHPANPNTALPCHTDINAPPSLYAFEQGSSEILSKQ